MFILIDCFVDKCNNTYHNTTKMNPIKIKSNAHAEYNVDSNVKGPKFKIEYYVRNF